MLHKSDIWNIFSRVIWSSGAIERLINLSWSKVTGSAGLRPRPLSIIGLYVLWGETEQDRPSVCLHVYFCAFAASVHSLISSDPADHSLNAALLVCRCVSSFAIRLRGRASCLKGSVLETWQQLVRWICLGRTQHWMSLRLSKLNTYNQSLTRLSCLSWTDQIPNRWMIEQTTETCPQLV